MSLSGICLYETALTCIVGSYQELIAISIYSGNLSVGLTFYCPTKGFAVLRCIFSNNTRHFTGSTGDRERCPYVFMANSQSDMEEWVRTLRRVIGVPASGGSVKHYTVLETDVMYDTATILFD